MKQAATEAVMIGVIGRPVVAGLPLLIVAAGQAQRVRAEIDWSGCDERDRRCRPGQPHRKREQSDQYGY